MGRQYKSFRERVFAKILRATERLELGDSFFPITAASANQPASASFTVAAEAANVINVAVQLKDANGNDLATAACVPWYISSDALGQAISTAHSVGASIGTDGLLQEFTANVAGLVTSEADGDIDIDFEEAAAKTAYLVLVMPSGSLQISGAITHAA